MSQDYRKKGLLKTIVLSVIIKHGKLHGYGVYREITSLVDTYNPSIGTIYRVLGSLYKEGLIDKEEVQGRRKVIYYKPTPRGKEEFMKTVNCFLTKTARGLSFIIPVLNKLRNEMPARDLFSIDSRIKEIAEMVNAFIDKTKVTPVSTKVK